jgi:hypothetical protein
MIGLLLIVLLAGVAVWFAWVYRVSPASDLRRITDSYAGTDARVIKIERVGTELNPGAVAWTADRASSTSSAWFRVYMVRLARPGGFEDKTVGVEVALYGLPRLKRYEPGD